MQREQNYNKQKTLFKGQKTTCNYQKNIVQVTKLTITKNNVQGPKINYN